MISKESLDEYKAIHKKIFNKDLADDEAFKKANDLFNFYKAIYTNHSVEQSEKNK